ncbi:MAG: calcium-binding protein [Planctomycetaceae bacterium]|nr:calcium-binding protein [Planctomycetaceae bacterium]
MAFWSWLKSLRRQCADLGRVRRRLIRFGNRMADSGREMNGRWGNSPGAEILEDRALLTTTIFLDFGVGFGSTGLTTTAGNLRDVDGSNTGPDLTTLGVGLSSSSNVKLTPLSYDYNGDGTINTTDWNELRNAVRSIVERVFEPFDIVVATSDATSLAAVQAQLGANAGDTTGSHDAYCFVTTMTSTVITTNGGSIGFKSSLFGLAAGIDLGGSRNNENDEAVAVFVDVIKASTSGTGTNEFNTNLAYRIAYTVAHEASHTFGLSHTINSDQGNNGLLVRGDVIQQSSDSRETDHTVTRFDLKLAGLSGSQNNYNELLNDSDIGFRDDDRDGIPDFAYVTGTGAHDSITITQVTNTEYEVRVMAYFDEVGGTLIDSTTYTIVVDTDTEGGILVEASLGDDVVHADGCDIQVTLRGGDGKDTLVGGNGSDELQGDAGADSLDGGNGTDRITDFGDVNYTLTATYLTGHGTDTFTHIEEALISGGAGNRALTVTNFFGAVTLNGGAGNDTLIGSAANEVLEGGDGDDVLTGNGGNDTFDGGSGTDTVIESRSTTYIVAGTVANGTLIGAGSDVLTNIERVKLTTANTDSSIDASGFSGNVTLIGGNGKDTLTGGSGNDSISSLSGDDLLTGNGGNDTIFGLAGKDTIDGGTGNDSVFAGDGNDVVEGGIGDDTLDGGTGADTINGDDGADKILGQADNDSLKGGLGNDTIDGGSGNDTIIGGNDDDSITGGAGNDAINGSDGHDLINGGDGNDTLVGGAGNDRILGGNGNDTLLGGEGDDTVNGQAGADRVAGNAGTNDVTVIAKDKDILDEAFTLSAALQAALEVI